MLYLDRQTNWQTYSQMYDRQIYFNQKSKNVNTENGEKIGTQNSIRSSKVNFIYGILKSIFITVKLLELMVAQFVWSSWVAFPMNFYSL